MKRLLTSAVLLTSVVSMLSRAAADDWPQWRGPGRDGRSSEVGLNTNWDAKKPSLIWMSSGLGAGFASVSIVGDRIYTTGNVEDAQAIVAIDANDGKVLWKTNVTEKPKHSYEGSRSTPTIDGDRAYAVSSDGKLVCVSTRDGKPLWGKDFKTEWNGRMMSGWGFAESPLVDGDRVICTPGGQQAMMVALDKMTGKEIWRCAIPTEGRGKPGAGYSSIVVSNASGVKQYVQLIGRGVIGVRAADGQFLWGYDRVANGTANIPTPIVSGDYVFASSGYNTGAALLKISSQGRGARAVASAEEVYFLEPNKMQNHHGGMVLVDDHIYCGHGHNNGFPICVNMATGDIVWGGKRGPGSGSAAVTYYDGHLVFRYQSGDVALFEAAPSGPELKGVFRPEYVKGPSWAHPVVVNGRLYLREQDNLMCYDLSK